MKCSNRGKDIPFAGNVCPYCNANKQGDQVVQVMGFVGVAIGCVVAFALLPALGVESFGAKLGTVAVMTVVFTVLGVKVKADVERRNKK